MENDDELKTFQQRMNVEARLAFAAAVKEAKAEGRTIEDKWREFWATVDARYEERERAKNNL